MDRPKIGEVTPDSLAHKDRVLFLRQVLLRCLEARLQRSRSFGTRVRLLETALHVQLVHLLKLLHQFLELGNVFVGYGSIPTVGKCEKDFHYSINFLVTGLAESVTLRLQENSTKLKN